MRGPFGAVTGPLTGRMKRGSPEGPVYGSEVREDPPPDRSGGPDRDLAAPG